jgi:hypothetical protein
MARKTQVIVTISHTRVNDLIEVLTGPHGGKDGNRLARLITMSPAAGAQTVLTLTRKDALAMHAAALNDIQMGGVVLTSRTYGQIEKAFRDAYDARLRAMCGE